MGGVGVRALERLEEGTWVDGGGVMFLGALSMRLDWTFETAAAVDSGMVVCDNSGVVGSETLGGGIRLSSGS